MILYRSSIVNNPQFQNDTLPIIQWDGSYWHNKQKRKMLDKSQDAYLFRCGYTVLRFSDNQVYLKPDTVLSIIRNTIAGLRTAQPLQPFLPI